MPRKSPYDSAIRDMVNALKQRGADMTLEHDSQGYGLYADNGARPISLRYPGREMLVFLTGYSKGREDEAVAQIAGGGTDLPDPPIKPADSEDPGVKH
jgi:hypothetical protein